MKTVLILGATSDIAKAIGKSFFNGGFNLVLGARNPEDLKAYENSFSSESLSITSLGFDALDFASHQLFFENLDVKPDVVIMCFGYLGQQEKSELDFSEAKRIIDTNYTGAVSFLEIVAAHMQASGQGSIIAISSVAGDRGKSSNYMYGSAKAGLTAFLSGLRQRLHKHGVHVLTVKPGFVYTKMTENMSLPARLTAQPEKVAKDVYKAYHSKRSVIYTKPIWRVILLIFRSIPEFVYKKMSL